MEDENQDHLCNSTVMPHFFQKSSKQHYLSSVSRYTENWFTLLYHHRSPERSIIWNECKPPSVCKGSTRWHVWKITHKTQLLFLLSAKKDFPQMFFSAADQHLHKATKQAKENCSKLSVLSVLRDLPQPTPQPVGTAGISASQSGHECGRGHLSFDQNG